MTSPLSRLAKLVEEIENEDAGLYVTMRESKFLNLARELLVVAQRTSDYLEAECLHGERLCSGQGYILREAREDLLKAKFALFAAVDREVGE